MAKRAGGDHLLPARGPGRPAEQPGEGSAAAPDAAGFPHPPLVSGKRDVVLVGHFGRAHGLKGEVRLKSLTADPKAIVRYGPLHAEDGRTFSLKHVRPAGGGTPDLVIARVDGIATRAAAEMLNRIQLFVPRERLRGGEAEGEFLLADLIGLRVKNEDGDVLGTIVAVPNYGAGDLLEIAPPSGGPTALLPFTEGFVPSIDVGAGEVVIAAPEGLFEEPPPARQDGRA